MGQRAQGHKSIRSLFATGAIILAMIACSTHAIKSPLEGSHRNHPVSQIANLHAFAHLYGLIRWFHPSDAAAVSDWDLLAVAGVHRVVDAPDAHELRARLLELFTPIAPTIRIVEPGEAFPDVPDLHQGTTTGLEVIAWQHRGYGDTTYFTDYVSKRTNHNGAVHTKGAAYAALSQSIDAIPLRGLRIRLRGKLRTSNRTRGRLWIRVDRGELAGFFDNMADHPVRSGSWAEGEIIGHVANDATRVVFGVLNTGPGVAWYDDLELTAEAADGTWRSIPIQNGDFEAPELAGWHAGTGRSPASSSTPPSAIDGWHIVADQESPASGKYALRVEPIVQIVVNPLFAQTPAPEETFDADLGSGLRVRVPLALYSKAEKTLGDDPDAALHAEAALRTGQYRDFDPLAGAADVVVLWNVFRHFWPYWNVVTTNWDEALDVALTNAMSNKSVDDLVLTLDRLSAAAPDAHVSPHCPGQSTPAYLPFSVSLIESKVVVTASVDPNVKLGDLLVEIDGRPAADLLDTERALISGSSQWQLARAMRVLGHGPLGSEANITLDRDDLQLRTTVKRGEQQVVEIPLQPGIQRFDDGVYYIDLSRAEPMEIEQIMDKLATAPGIVFDVRHFPKRYDVLSHVVTVSNVPAGWESIPLITRPDSAANPAAWEDTSTSNMPRMVEQKPHLGGRIAVMTGPEAFSGAESVMALVEYYHIGEIVGAPTAGTNGDIAEVTLPSGCATTFTGRRVTRIDGRPSHLIGILPTIPAERTLAGVRSSRDEVLEKALAYVRTGAK